MNPRLFLFLKIILTLGMVALTAVTVGRYSGNPIAYLVFSIAFNGLLWMGFRKDRFFFDTFVGVFFWLGFWLKFSYRISFSGGEFVDPVGYFDHSPASFDHALWVSSTGAFGLITASMLRSRLGFVYRNFSTRYTFAGFRELYSRHRLKLLSLFLLVVFAVTSANAIFGFYQRGSTPRTVLPFGLSGIVTWLLLFGFTSFTATFLNFETLRTSNPYIVTFLACVECFLSNVSLLSRGMVINMSSIGAGILSSVGKNGFRPKLIYYMVSGMVFCGLFFGSVFGVNFVRMKTFPNLIQSSASTEKTASEAVQATGYLFMDRFVGIEGVMAVVGSPKRGPELWKSAWTEKFANNGTSLYDREVLKDTYAGVDLSQHHLISLPGSIAFFYYAGSFGVLFLGMFFLGTIAAGFEFAAYRWGGNNLILCAVIGQVIAYRYAHFGYVPRQSYLLFGTVLLNIGILYGLDRISERFQKT